MLKPEAYKILSIEAKDVYGAMHQKNKPEEEQGYGIRNSNGELSLKKFQNTIDYSLDLIQLKDVYRKIYRRNDFATKIGKHFYCQQVICVTFSYAYKTYNMAGRSTYILNGYNYRDCSFKDGLCVCDGELRGIQLGIKVEDPSCLNPEISGAEYFGYDEDTECYVLKKQLPTLMDKTALREWIYKNGFVCDGIRYIRYKRSAGSSRVGKCLFVNDALAPDMEKFDKCGVELSPGQQWDLAAWESYIALPMSAIIDTIEIPLDSILVIDDAKSKFTDTVVAVTYEDKQLRATERPAEISNTIWDGQSLIDKSIMGKYEEKGMILIRNRFFKSCCFNTNLQQWFVDNNITSVDQLKGLTLAKDISQIKLVTTPSSIKYCKFGSIEQWLNNVSSTFGVVKYEKKPHPFDGRMVQSHYQLLNTLQTSYEEMEEILQPSLDYIAQVRRSPSVLRYAVQYPVDQDIEDDDEEWHSLNSKNEIVFKMLGINDMFAKTKLYYDFRDDLIRSEIRQLKRGHILVNGNYSTLFGNGAEMLRATIGQFDGVTSELKPGQIFSKRFPFNKTILGSRSPHITVGNIMLSENTYREIYDKYFNLTPEIVCINSMNENILQRLDGADFDSDTVLLIDSDKLVEIARRNYDLFKVPTSFVESKHHVRYYNDEDKADLDVKTSVNKIGEIVNLSQQLNSLMWEKMHKGKTYEDIKGLYYDICILAVLSGIEIDKAKKEFEVNSGSEITRIKKKYKLLDDSKTVKPMFFKMITTENGYQLSDNIKYRYFFTAMDYLQKIVSKFNFREGRTQKRQVIPFMDLVKEPDANNARQGFYYSQKDKIIKVIRQARAEKSKLFSDYDTLSQEEKKIVWRQVGEIKQSCIETIEKMCESPATMYYTLSELDKDDAAKDIARFVFEVLFGKPNQLFFTMIKESRDHIYGLVETDEEDCDLTLYGFKFNKIKLNNLQ